MGKSEIPKGYLTASEAERRFGIKRKSILAYRALGGFPNAISRHYKGHDTWFFPVKDMEDYAEASRRVTSRSTPRIIKIGGDEFISVHEAASREKVPVSTMRHRMKKRGYPSARQIDGLWYASADEVSLPYQRRPTLLDALELDGVLYVSVPEAAKVFGMTPNSILTQARDGIFASVREVNGHYYIAVDEVYENCHADAESFEGLAARPLCVPRVREFDGQTFISLWEAMLRLDVKYGDVYYRLRRGDFPSARQVGVNWYIREDELSNRVTKAKFVRVPRVLALGGEQYISLDEAASRLGVSYGTVHARMKRGAYPLFRREGMGWYISEDELQNTPPRKGGK